MKSGKLPPLAKDVLREIYLYRIIQSPDFSNLYLLLKRQRFQAAILNSKSPEVYRLIPSVILMAVHSHHLDLLTSIFQVEHLVDWNSNKEFDQQKYIMSKETMVKLYLILYEENTFQQSFDALKIPVLYITQHLDDFALMINAPHPTDVQDANVEEHVNDLPWMNIESPTADLQTLISQSFLYHVKDNDPVHVSKYLQHLTIHEHISSGYITDAFYAAATQGMAEILEQFLSNDYILNLIPLIDIHHALEKSLQNRLENIVILLLSNPIIQARISLDFFDQFFITVCSRDFPSIIEFILNSRNLLHLLHPEIWEEVLEKSVHGHYTTNVQLILEEPIAQTYLSLPSIGFSFMDAVHSKSMDVIHVFLRNRFTKVRIHSDFLILAAHEMVQLKDLKGLGILLSDDYLKSELDQGLWKNLLYEASERGHEQVVFLLLQHWNWEVNGLFESFQVALFRQFGPVVKLFLSNTAMLQSMTQVQASNALISCLVHSNPTIVLLLLKHQEFRKKLSKNALNALLKRAMEMEWFQVLELFSELNLFHELSMDPLNFSREKGVDHLLRKKFFQPQEPAASTFESREKSGKSHKKSGRKKTPKFVLSDAIEHGLNENLIPRIKKLRDPHAISRLHEQLQHLGRINV